MKADAKGESGSEQVGPLTVLVTGAKGFIGRHLVEALGRRPNTKVIEYDLGTSDEALERGLREADVIFHLAGVNRPQDPAEFQAGNADFTAQLCARLTSLRPPNSVPGSPSSAPPASCSVPGSPLLVLSSSIQAALNNPYGVSKRQAEEAVAEWAKGQAARAIIFRLKNVFGKWCRPNYNSVTATFCHNIAHDLPITISDPDRELELVYIDDVVEAFMGVVEELSGKGEEPGAVPSAAFPCLLPHSGLPLSPSLLPPRTSPLPLTPLPSVCELREVAKSYRVTLGDLAARIRSFRESRRSLVLPDFSDDFNRCLYATYLSYLDGPEFAYRLDQKTDPRGSLAEFVKSSGAGQIFVSRTKPGITRGNHYHHTKTEKFLVVEGEAVIRFRRVSGEQRARSGEREAESSKLQAPNSLLPPPPIIEHRVSGHEFKVVDIPPGYTHSIENVGSGELVTLFWASEVFDPARPDTYFQNVLP